MAFACPRVDQGYAFSVSSTVGMASQSCPADPTTWRPESDYEFALWADDDDTRFADIAVADAVRTPAEIQVTSPDTAILDLPFELGTPLELTWTPADDDAEVALRIWDLDGRMFSARLTDSGAFTIPADISGELVPGPITISIARELNSTVSWSEGNVQALARDEQRIYMRGE